MQSKLLLGVQARRNKDNPTTGHLWNRIATHSDNTRHVRSTFMVEALLLFTCLLIMVAVVMSVLTYANYKGAHAAHLNRAIIMATQVAEQFQNNPLDIERSYSEDDYTADCSISAEIDGIGALLSATITVSWQGQDIYAIKTVKYMNNSELADVDRLNGALPMGAKGSQSTDLSLLGGES